MSADVRPTSGVGKLTRAGPRPSGAGGLPPLSGDVGVGACPPATSSGRVERRSPCVLPYQPGSGSKHQAPSTKHGRRRHGPLTIHELDAATAAWIAREVDRLGVPTETVARRLLRQGLEVEWEKAQPHLHHDLAALAGTWSAEETAEFLRVVDDFDRVDPALWR